MSETFLHLCELVLRHQMRVSNYFVNSFYSVLSPLRYLMMHNLYITNVDNWVWILKGLSHETDCVFDDMYG
jgi:hypothetical protein